jgi:hypothetical protein
VKGSFYEELDSVFSKLPKYHMKILLGDFNDKVNRGDILIQQFATTVYTKLVVIMELE